MGFSANEMLSGGQQGSGQVNVVLGIAGAAAAAIVVGIVYGVIGRVAFEHSAVAVLVGLAAGAGALKLGGGQSLIVGVAAAVLTLVGSIIGKLIIGSPEGVSWVAYHTTMFDILFCYVTAPIAAFAICGTDKLMFLRRYLPF
jgi:hypothetical protein